MGEGGAGGQRGGRAGRAKGGRTGRNKGGRKKEEHQREGREKREGEGEAGEEGKQIKYRTKHTLPVTMNTYTRTSTPGNFCWPMLC